MAQSPSRLILCLCFGRPCIGSEFGYNSGWPIFGVIILRRFFKTCGCIGQWCGYLCALLLAAMIVLLAALVLLRHGWSLGSIALQELVGYLHSGVFLLGAAYALHHNAHVRVDVFYRRLTVQGRAWVDFLGTLLLLWPVLIGLAYVSWEYVAVAWSYQEGSRETGGLPFVYLQKSLILAMLLGLGLQSLSNLWQAWEQLRRPEEAN